MKTSSSNSNGGTSKPAATPASSSGRPLPAVGVPFLRAIEVQVLDHGYGNTENYTTHGDVFAIHGASMKPFPPTKACAASPRKSAASLAGVESLPHHLPGRHDPARREWQGSQRRHDCVWRKGYLGLESEGGPVDWRNLRIKELSGGKATAEQTAPAADGSVSLYDGRSLRGWTASAGAEWKARDWELVGPEGGGTLTLRKKPLNFRLQFDLRTDAQAGDAPLPVCINGQTLPGRATGQWTRYTVIRRGARLDCQPEGGAGAMMSLAEGPAEISLKAQVSVRVAGLSI